MSTLQPKGIYVGTKLYNEMSADESFTKAVTGEPTLDGIRIYLDASLPDDVMTTNDKKIAEHLKALAEQADYAMSRGTNRES